jgi:hypothetical protein
MESSSDFKGYKFVTLKGSASHLSNNLTTNGQYYAYASNVDNTPKVYIFDQSYFLIFILSLATEGDSSN